MAMTHAAASQESRVVEFDAAFLPDGPHTLDIARFARGNPVLPGIYDVDVWLNDEWQAHVAMPFASTSDVADASPCITDDQLVGFGIDPSAVHPSADPCLALGQRVSSSSVRFDVGQQRLDLEVPQAALPRRRDIASPDQWDQGITAGLLSWRGSARRTAFDARHVTSSYLSAEAGVNHGPWRLRHADAYSSGRYRRSHTYVERHLIGWTSQLRVGDVSSAGDLLPPVPLLGIALSSDSRMSSTGDNFAPRVTGVAATHATVRVTQNGVLLREVLVPPGPFVIDDLHALGRAGDLDVDIEERDGHHRRFRVPYFPLPERLEEGRTAFSVDAGRLATGRKPGHAVQGTWRHGFPGDTAAFVAARHAGDMSTLLVGAAVDTLAGALAADVTHVAATSGRSRSWRLRHGRRWTEASMLSIALAGGREPMRTNGRVHARPRPVRRVDALYQRELKGERGHLTVSASRASRRRGPGSLEQALAWTRSWGSVSFDASIRWSRQGERERTSRERSGQIGVSMPLGVPASPQLHATIRESSQGRGERIGLHGTAGETADTLYTVALGREDGDGARMDASVSRRLRAAEVSATVDRSARSHTLVLAASGGLVMHAGGVTFAQRLGDAVGLVHAEGAHGARVGGYAGVTLDRRGYALVPYLMPYRWNAIDLDPAGVPLDVELGATHRRVAATSGAVALIPFTTRVGRTHLVVARRPDGRPLPFGADIVDGEGRSVGLVGQAGRIFLRTDDPLGRWNAHWPGDPPGRCELRLVDTQTTAAGDARHTGVCE